jgi:DNA uptake protein ComE-like DNA-binding protein
MPDWLQEAGETLVTEPEESAQPAEELPDWLKTMQLEEEPEPGQLEKDEDLPDWLKETEEELEFEQPEPETDEDWLAELEEPIIEGDTKPTRLVTETQEPETELLEEVPTMYAPPGEAEEEYQTEDETQEIPPEETTIQPEAEDTEIDADLGFAWLESLAAKQGADEGMLLTPEERQEIPPEWIQSALDKQFGEVEEQATIEEQVASEEKVASELEPVTPEETAETQETVEGTPELPEWLSDMEAETEPDETAQAIEEIAESAAVQEAEEEIPELPSWLADTEDKEAETWTPPEPVVEKLDLNRASLAELERLPGIGFIMAQKIVTYRELTVFSPAPLIYSKSPDSAPPCWRISKT